MTAVYLKRRPPSSPLFVEKFNFLYDSCGHFLHAFLSFTSTSSLAIYCEPSSTEGVRWSATEVPQASEQAVVPLTKWANEFMHKPFLRHSPAGVSKWPPVADAAGVARLFRSGPAFPSPFAEARPAGLVPIPIPTQPSSPSIAQCRRAGGGQQAR